MAESPAAAEDAPPASSSEPLKQRRKAPLINPDVFCGVVRPEGFDDDDPDVEPQRRDVLWEWFLDRFSEFPEIPGAAAMSRRERLRRQLEALLLNFRSALHELPVAKSVKGKSLLDLAEAVERISHDPKMIDYRFDLIHRYCTTDWRAEAAARKAARAAAAPPAPAPAAAGAAPAAAAGSQPWAPMRAGGPPEDELDSAYFDFQPYDQEPVDLEPTQPAAPSAEERVRAQRKKLLEARRQRQQEEKMKALRKLAIERRRARKKDEADGKRVAGRASGENAADDAPADDARRATSTSPAGGSDRASGGGPSGRQQENGLA